MPVYLRKNVVFTPPSIDNMSDENEDDYIRDPDQLRDNLPQPYRMINKLIQQLFDNVWEIVSEEESKRFAEQSKIRPPKYDCAVEMQTYHKALALSDSVDGRYIFIGMPNGLTVIDALSQRPVVIWEEENAEITQIKAHVIGLQTYLVVTIDDMGTARLFAFAFDCLFLLKILNEQEGGAKYLVSKCEASLEGDYVGVVLENTGTKEIWLEVHKLPRDGWLRELEAIQSQMPKPQSDKKDNPQDVQPGDGQTGEAAHEDGETEQKGQVLEKPRSGSSSSRRSQSSDKQRKRKSRSGSPKATTPPPVIGNPGDKTAYKFSPPALVLKVRPPSPVTGCPAPSVSQACQKVDSGEVIGTGKNHILSSSHLEQRGMMFEHLHENLLKYLPKQEKYDDSDVTPHFHFLNAGRMIPLGLEQPSQSGHPTSVAIWWSRDTHLMQYSLLKVGKEFEHKADLVWPFTCKITASAMTTCNSLLAIGLENGTVSVWDRYLGLDKGVISVSKESGIQSLKFLDPAICPEENPNYPPYKTKSATCLLMQCNDGSEYLYDTGTGPSVLPLCLAARPEKDEETEMVLDVMPDIPEVVLLVQRNGSLVLKDVTNGINLCELLLPATHQLTSPWEPVTAFGAGGQLLYVQGTRKETAQSEDDDTIPGDKASIFIFQLRSFLSLDQYWKRRREPVQLLVHTTVDQRTDALLKERIAQQALRKTRMQMRWGMLRQEFDLIQQCREAARKQAGSRYIFL